MVASISNNEITLVDWPNKGVLAFQTTSKLNHSLTVNNIYGQFNLGLHVGDDEKLVLEKRAHLSGYLPTNQEIQWLDQIHSGHVIQIKEYQDSPPKADAAITTQKNIALAIMTADCLPILLSNKQGDEIAAIHAGWRPLAKNIVANTVESMRSNSSELCAWLGPCISQNHFEVGEEVKQAFELIDPNLSKYFLVNNDKFNADLVGITKSLLLKEGITNISCLNECTFSMVDKYYSYRRQSITGRMASVISMV